jgi:hypothetical protein
MNRDMDPLFDMKWIATAIAVWFRDWWRGWSDADLASIEGKMAMFGEGEQQIFVRMTPREFRAFQAYEREHYSKAAKVSQEANQ